MAFSDMNDVEQELGEEKPPERNGNRTFLIIAGALGGIMVLALLCIAALALFRYLPSQQAAQHASETKAAEDTAVAISANLTAAVPTATATRKPTSTPTNTLVPTTTPVIVIIATKTATIDAAAATRNAALTQAAQQPLVTITPAGTVTVAAASPTATRTATVATPVKTFTAVPTGPTATALPTTGIGDELGSPGLIVAAVVLMAIIFLLRKLRTAIG